MGDSHVPLLLQPSVKARWRCSHCSSSSALRFAAAAARRPTRRSQRSTTVTSARVPLEARSSSSADSDRPLLPLLPLLLVWPAPASCRPGPCVCQRNSIHVSWLAGDARVLMAWLCEAGMSCCRQVNCVQSVSRDLPKQRQKTQLHSHAYAHPSSCLAAAVPQHAACTRHKQVGHVGQG